MNTLYSIIQSLRNASGNIAKQAILDANKDNELFKAYMKAVYDVGINYYQKKLSKDVARWPGDRQFEQMDIDYMVNEIAARKVTGLEAHVSLTGWASALGPEGRELVQYMLDRKIGASVGDSMVLKTWPDLYFLPPYARCSLLDKKARERFAKLKRFYVQTKADGSFAYVVKRWDGSVDVITRQGSKYPQWFAEHMAKSLKPGMVLVGELLVDEKQDVQGWGETVYHVDRKTANGLLNSALKDGDKFDLNKYSVRMQAWDFLRYEQFEEGKAERPYGERLAYLEMFANEESPANIEVIFTAEVGSLEDAFVVYQEHLKRGLEGCIIKDPDSMWKNGTAKDMVKLKLKFQVEMRVTGIYEGEGKDAGSLGGVNLSSEDGGIENNCGSGFDGPQRREFWDHPERILNQIVMVEANDITQSRDERKKPALSLPIFCEVRSDKTVADTTERIYAQLEAAKNA